MNDALSMDSVGLICPKDCENNPNACVGDDNLVADDLMMMEDIMGDDAWTASRDRPQPAAVAVSPFQPDEHRMEMEVDAAAPPTAEDVAARRKALDDMLRRHAVPTSQQGQHRDQGELLPDPRLTGRPPALLYLTCNDQMLSEYQCLIRKNIELFEAKKEEVDTNAKGRNRPIVLGQVGIRCHSCAHLPPKHRSKGAMYYPAKLEGLYQAAQTIGSVHLCDSCPSVGRDLRAELLRLRERTGSSGAGGGKGYWAETARALGVFEDEDGLRFERRSF